MSGYMARGAGNGVVATLQASAEVSNFCQHPETNSGGGLKYQHFSLVKEESLVSATRLWKIEWD